MVADPSHAALGLTLPATAEPAGKTAETKKGNLKSLNAGASVLFEVEIGALAPAGAAEMSAKIKGIVG